MDIVVRKAGGLRYRTRDGRLAIVLESNVILVTGEHIWQGRVGAHWCEWMLDGKHLGGNSALDLVAYAAE